MSAFAPLRACAVNDQLGRYCSQHASVFRADGLCHAHGAEADETMVLRINGRGDPRKADDPEERGPEPEGQPSRSRRRGRPPGSRKRRTEEAGTR